jgi:ATP-dependent DNA ligase
VLLATPRATRNCGRKSNFDKAQGSAHNDVADIRAWREGRPKSPKLRKPCRPFFAFDLLVLLELDGRDMRRAPIEERKAALAKLLRRPSDGIALNEHYTGVGAIICKHPCALGCKGIVSKRLGYSYRPGRADWWCRITFSTEL